MNWWRKKKISPSILMSKILLLFLRRPSDEYYTSSWFRRTRHGCLTYVNQKLNESNKEKIENLRMSHNDLCSRPRNLYWYRFQLAAVYYGQRLLRSFVIVFSARNYAFANSKKKEKKRVTRNHHSLSINQCLKTFYRKIERFELHACSTFKPEKLR